MSFFEFLKQVVSHKILGFFFRMLLGATFLYACYDKILHPEAFAEAVANYRMLPAALVGLLAVTLPWVELFCGLFLILGLFIRSSALIVSLMFFVFSIALSAAVLRGIDIDCGCFRVTDGGHSVTVGLILRDLGYLVLSLHVLFFDKGFLSFSPLIRQLRRKA
ncbi:MAG: DoxX family membrane protein [Gemmatimonadota bacterium]|nr:MAG: DoxX family membrane protein [Gemmatimonadota bacterium]